MAAVPVGVAIVRPKVWWCFATAAVHVGAAIVFPILCCPAMYVEARCVVPRCTWLGCGDCEPEITMDYCTG
jgi:hypothetical protein